MDRLLHIHGDTTPTDLRMSMAGGSTTIEDKNNNDSPPAKTVPFAVVSCSGQDEDYPASELNKGVLGRGWQSSRFCSFPQELVLELQQPSRVINMQLLCHEYKIPSKVEVFVSMMNPYIHSEEAIRQMKRLGYLSLDPNDHSGHQARELKSIYVDSAAAAIRLLLHNCYSNKLNVYNQVGLMALIITGDILEDQTKDYSDLQDATMPLHISRIQVASTNALDSRKQSPSPLAVDVNLKDFDSSTSVRLRQVASTNALDSRKQSPSPLAVDVNLKDFDSSTSVRLRQLFQEKNMAVAREDYDEAKRLKAVIERLKEHGKKIKHLERQKLAAVEVEDYDTAKHCKMEIERLQLCDDGPDEDGWSDKIKSSDRSEHGSTGACSTDMLQEGSGYEGNSTATMSEHIKKETGTQTVAGKNNNAVQLGNGHGESGLPTMVQTTLESIPTYSSFKISPGDISGASNSPVSVIDKQTGAVPGRVPWWQGHGVLKSSEISPPPTVGQQGGHLLTSSHHSAATKQMLHKNNTIGLVAPAVIVPTPPIASASDLILTPQQVPRGPQNSLKNYMSNHNGSLAPLDTMTIQTLPWNQSKLPITQPAGARVKANLTILPAPSLVSKPNELPAEFLTPYAPPMATTQKKLVPTLMASTILLPPSRTHEDEPEAEFCSTMWTQYSHRVESPADTNNYLSPVPPTIIPFQAGGSSNSHCSTTTSSSKETDQVEAPDDAKLIIPSSVDAIIPSAVEEILVPEALADSVKLEAGPLLSVLDLYHVECLYSKHWQLREKTLLFLMEEVAARNFPEEPPGSFKTLYRVLLRALNDRVANVYNTSLQLLRMVITTYSSVVPHRELQVTSIGLINILVEKLGDSNVRTKEASCETLMFLASRKEIGIHTLSGPLLKPVKNQGIWRPVLGRLHLLHNAIPLFGIQPPGRSGFSSEDLMTFVRQAFNSPNGDVRNTAIKVTTEVYRLMGAPVEKYLKGIKPVIREVLTSNFERVTRELEERNEMFAINPVKSDERAHDVGLHPLRVTQALENGGNKSHELLALSPRKSGSISSRSSQEQRVDTDFESQMSPNVLFSTQDPRERPEFQGTTPQDSEERVRQSRLSNEEDGDLRSVESPCGSQHSHCSDREASPDSSNHHLQEDDSLTDKDENADSCLFCGKQDSRFMEGDNLDLHFCQQCPMLASCSNCGQIVEISSLKDHYLFECTSGKRYVECQKCYLAVPETRLAAHQKSKDCRRCKQHGLLRCPLCFLTVEPGDKGWRDHILKQPGCLQNPRPSIHAS